jgi:hypothetical protein
MVKGESGAKNIGEGALLFQRRAAIGNLAA